MSRGADPSTPAGCGVSAPGLAPPATRSGPAPCTALQGAHKPPGAEMQIDRPPHGIHLTPVAQRMPTGCVCSIQRLGQGVFGLHLQASRLHIQREDHMSLARPAV